jgi:HD-like signal output (HDOD) protein
MPNQPQPRPILSEMLRKGALRALDRNVADVCAITQNTERSFAELSEAIMRDAALSANLLATANSAVYGGIEPVRTISAAVLRLGFEKVRALALGLAIFKQAGRSARTPDLYRMYAAAYFSASLGRELLRRAGYRTSEEGFVAALLVQVPRLLLANTFPQDYKDMERLISSEDLPPEEACRRVFGTPYSEIRQAVLEHWHLQEEATPRAEDEEAAQRRLGLVEEAAHLADMLFGNAGGGEAGLARAEARLRELLNEQGVTASDLIRDTSERDENVRRFFKLSPKDIEMMVQIAQWGRVNTAQIAASLTLGSAQEELDEGGEAPEVAIGNYLTEMMCLCRRGADINHLLVLAQEAAFRCLRPSHVILGLLDSSQTVLRGRLHAGAAGRLSPSILNVIMTRLESPIVHCMLGRSPVRREIEGEGWEPGLIAETRARYVLMVPIVAHERAIGLHFVARCEQPPFSKLEQTWCEAIAGNLGFAFERRR